MLKIKLRPTGKVHQRSFRIVVSPDRSKSNGKFIDDLGFYTPQTNTLKIDKDKIIKWQKNGAQITLGVDKLLNPDKYPRKKKVKKSEKIVTPQPKTETKAEELKTEEKSQNINQNPSLPTDVKASPSDKEGSEEESAAKEVKPVETK